MKLKHSNPVPHESSNRVETSNNLHRLATAASFELLARDIVRRPTILANLHRGTKVYVPFPPSGSWEETLAACRLLSENGCCPVPHLPARRVRDREELIFWVKSLERSDIRTVMLIAGDVQDEKVYFNDSLEVLQTKILATHGIRKVGVAVYPEGHPFLTSQDLEYAFRKKLEIASRDGFALHAVTQFGFDASRLLTWLANSQDSIFHVPLSVGVAGPTKMNTLIRYASKCGVSHAVKGLFVSPNVLRVVGRWDPLQVLLPVAEWLASGVDIHVENAHVFTFGGLERVLQWRERLLRGCELAVTSNERQ